MSKTYLDLEWLETAPERLPPVHADPSQELQILRTLAGTRLKYHQLDRVASRLSALPADLRSVLRPMRLALVSDANHALLRGSLVATALRHGIALELRELKLADVLAADAWVDANEVDVVLLALDIRQLHDPRKASALSPTDVPGWLEAQRDWFAGLVRSIQTRSRALLLIQNFVTTSDQIALGRGDRGSASALSSLLNEEIEAFAASGAWTLDWLAMTRVIGDEHWTSPTLWDLAKCPVSMEAAPLYADTVLRQIVGAQGRAGKCLVLDLDNTLWGGVLADEGAEGIRIRQGDAVGEAYLRFQHLIRRMRDQGVLLAICSKNDLSLVLQAFEQNDELVLRREHFSSIRANWQDKATNITEIAEELGLGLDAMVFFDDNPAERHWVRRQLPMVKVVEVPKDPALYALTLTAARYFSFDRSTQEDGLRAADYQANARRRALSETMGSKDEFIRSLGIKLSLSRIGAPELQRSVQLLNKTNQFNANKRVLTEAALREAIDDPDGLALCARLEDRFGDQGLISVVVATAQQGALVVSDWVMSCRVIGRGVEHSVMAALFAHAEAAGLEAVSVRYRPTAVNGMVRQFLQEVGLATEVQADDGSPLVYARPVSGFQVAQTIADVLNDL